MKLIRIRVFLSLILMNLITSCATPYQDSGFTGGVTSLQLSENSYRIVASGNGFTSAATLDGYALRKASELAIQSGYDSFYFLNENVEEKNSSITTGGTSNTYGNVSSNGNINTTTNYSPPTTTPITKYVVSKDVILVNKNDMINSGIVLFDAHIIRSNFETE